ncbi:MAG TPA: hypothetical protein VHW09_27065 [Bryobacteraceae bacterium]|jgi:hypothetical protein|nr:hypothetical protein [Bryobacteraceae bacterium]
MRNAIQYLLDLSEPPSWRELAQGLLGTAALFTGIAAFVFIGLALGWGQS